MATVNATDEEAPVAGVEQPAPNGGDTSPAVVRGCLFNHRYLALAGLSSLVIAAVLLGVFLSRGDACSARCFNDWNTLCDCVQQTSDDNQVFTLCSGTYHTHNRALELPASNNLTLTCENAVTGTKENGACVLMPKLQDLDTVFMNAIEGDSNASSVLLQHLTFTSEPVDSSPIGWLQTYDVIISAAGRPVDLVDCAFEVSSLCIV